MKGLKVPKSETIEIIAYECQWCGRAFRERTLSRHRCQKKAKALGIEEHGTFPGARPDKEEKSEVPF